jgi:hypothetical protein
MRIWLIGAGRIGMNALTQLEKNSDVTVIISDPSQSPPAVQQGLIDKVDYVTNVTPINVNELARRIRPDVILISPSEGEHSFGRLEGGRALADALNYEIASASDYPCLVLSQSNL